MLGFLLFFFFVFFWVGLPFLIKRIERNNGRMLGGDGKRGSGGGGVRNVYKVVVVFKAQFSIVKC